MKIGEMLKMFISSWGFVLGIIPFVVLLFFGAYYVFTNLSGAAAVSAYKWGIIFGGFFVVTFVVLLVIGIIIIKYEGD